MRNHRALTVFKLADDLALAVYAATGTFPKSEQFGLVSQMRRAAVSVPSNIAEGCSRHSEAEFVHFLHIALGSARELEYQASLAQRLGFFRDSNIEIQANSLCRTLSVFINKIRA
ncbi:MAG: four helix bundle protein [Holophagaceae bacterium]|nr:four helix bundle protein [Holophagaceae bacterium]